MAPFGGATPANGESNIVQIAPSAGTVQKLRVQLDAAPGSGKSYVITFRKELADTSITCTVSNLETSCSDIVNTSAIVAGDRVSVQITPSGTPAAARVSFILEFVPTTTGETVLMGASNGALASGTIYGAFTGALASASEAAVYVVIPTGGTLKNLYTRLSAAPGTDNTRIFTVRKNGVDTSLTKTFGATDSGVLSDTVNTVTVAAGDLITLQKTETGTPASALGAWGVTFVPTTSGDFVIPALTTASVSASAVNYIGLAGNSTISATETVVQTLGWSDYTLQAAYVKLGAAPGASKSFDTALRENAGNPSNTFAVNISGSSATTGSLTGQSFTPTDGALYDTRITPSGTPSAGRTFVSYLGHITTDITPPVISSIASSTTTTTATITWTTDEAATSTVNYGATSGYGTASTSDSLVTSHSIVLTGLSDGTLYHFNVGGADASGNISTSSDNTFTTVVADVTSPVQSSITSSPSYTTATITWTTDEAADTQINYGTTTAYSASTTLDATLATSHSQSLNQLRSGTTYHYRVRSTDSSGNLSISSDQTFTTTSFGGTYPVVDLYMDMEGGTINATTTSTILTAGTHGSGGTWTTHSTEPYDGPFTAVFVSTSTNAEHALPVPVRVGSGGTVYDDAASSKGWAYDQRVPDQEIIYTLGSSYNKLTVSGFAQFNAVLQIPGNNEQWDQLVMTGTSPGQGGGVGAQSVVMQQSLSSSNTLRLHVSGTTAGTTFSTGIPITAGTTYWYSMQWNKTDLKTYLSLYNPITWNLVGSVDIDIYNDANQNATVRSIVLMQDHAVVSQGTYQYWDDLLIDYTNALYPLVPDAYPPLVEVTVPSASATLSGSTVTLTSSSTDNVAIAGVQFKLDTNTNIGSEITATTSSPNNFSLTWNSTSVSDGSHTIIAVSRDTMGNYATSSAITVTVSNDSTAPSISAGSPSGSQSAGTTGVTLSLTTNEAATCKYGTTASTAYASIASTFTTTGGATHSASITGLSNGTSYSYYIRCTDGTNANTSDYTISFSVAAAANTSSGSGSVASRVTNLIATGNSEAAEALRKQYPFLYPPTTPSSKPIFTRGLETGKSGTDVRTLQQILAKDPSIYPEGRITGYFGPLTEKAVKRFQLKYKLAKPGDPGYGYVGPKTRRKMGEL